MSLTTEQRQRLAEHFRQKQQQQQAKKEEEDRRFAELMSRPSPTLPRLRPKPIAEQ